MLAFVAHRQEGEGFSDEVQKPEETELKDADTNNSKAEAQPKGNKKTRQKKVKPGDEPLVLFNDKGILDGLEQFFGLASSFPLRTQLVTRTGLEDQTATRKIYIVSSGTSFFKRLFLYLLAFCLTLFLK